MREMNFEARIGEIVKWLFDDMQIEWLDRNRDYWTDLLLQPSTTLDSVSVLSLSKILQIQNFPTWKNFSQKSFWEIFSQ